MRFFDSENVTLLMFSPNDVPEHVYVALTKRYENLSFRLWFLATALVAAATVWVGFQLREQQDLAYEIALVAGIITSITFAIVAGSRDNLRRKRVKDRQDAFAGEYREHGLVRSSDPSYRYLVERSLGRRMFERLTSDKFVPLVVSYFASKSTVRADRNIRLGYFVSRQLTDGSPIDAYFNAKMYLHRYAREVINSLVGDSRHGLSHALVYRKHFDALLHEHRQELTELEKSARYRLMVIQGQTMQLADYQSRVQ